MKRIRILPTLLLLCSFTAASADWRHNRIIAPQRVTIGPSDNYQSAPDPDNGTLFFTRHRHQIVQLYRQDLATGETQRLLDAADDAKDPAVSPDGAWLAYTGFAHDAQGDICLYPLRTSRPPRCLDRPASAEQTPFWLDSHRLGFLSRTPGDDNASLLLYTIHTGETQELMRGKIAAPTASPDGRYLAYTLRRGDAPNRLYLYDLHAHREYGPVPLALPGTSSYPRFSRDGRYLYFGRYLNDTSGDQQIDGNDHSVIFRARVDTLLHATAPVLPEQLTSVKEDCNFPVLAKDTLYVTCAYEGALSVYRLPPEGEVPADWNRTSVLEAHRNATGYEDRLLLLNTLRFRFGSGKGDAKTALMERQLADHLHIGEFSAARYYSRQIEKQYDRLGRPALRDFYFNLTLLLEARSEALRQPPGILTADYALGLEHRRAALHGSGPDREVFEAWIDHLLKRDKKALRRLEPLWHHPQKLTPMAFYLAVDLGRVLLSHDPDRLGSLLLGAAKTRTITQDSRLYYAYTYLRLLARIRPDLSQRSTAVAEAIGTLDERETKDLFQNELDVIALIRAQTPQQKKKRLNTITTRLKHYRSRYSLCRMMHIRAITLLGNAGAYRYMELLSRHWLTITDIDDMAFADVAELYAVITMQKAYGLLNDGDLRGAANTFYSAIRQTDDLEAHFAFITLGMHGDNAQRQQMEKAYRVLKHQHLLGANAAYVEALRLLLDDPSESIQTLEKAAALLEHFRPEGLSPAVRNLLLGYVYHRQMLKTRKGYHYDKALYQKANYQYMLALDLSYDNERTKAAVLQNLGQLHFAAANDALAADFFLQRATLPFRTREDEATLRWHLARALFYDNSPKAAAAQIDRALQLTPATEALRHTAMTQRSAFYHMYAHDYAGAEALYARVLASDELSTFNRAKATLAYGYTLFKQHKVNEAAAAFEKVIEQTADLSALPADARRAIPFEPQRLSLLAYGFLAQCSDTPQAKAGYLEKRIALLDAIAPRYQDFAYERKSVIAFKIKALLQSAAAYERSGRRERMREKAAEAVGLIGGYLEAGGAGSAQAVLRPLDSYLALALLYPDTFKAHPLPQLRERADAAVAALTLTPYTPPVMLYERYKLQMLYAAYETHVTGQQSEKALRQRLWKLHEEPERQILRQQRPDLDSKLERLQKRL